MTIPEPFAHLANIETTNQLPADFKDLGKLGDVYPAYDGDDYIIHIWENADGDRIALAHLGGNEIAYLANGSIQGIAAYLHAGYSRQPDPNVNAVVGDQIIYMSKNLQVAKNSQLGIGASYTVNGVTTQGVLVNIKNQTHQIAHGEYVVL